MKFVSPIFFLMVLAIFARIIFVLVNPDISIAFQQDEYGYYAKSIINGKIAGDYFSDYSRRLMPGYPILMVVGCTLVKSLTLSGFLISFFASLGSVILLFKITKNIIPALIYAIFPPIWVEQSVKITTEPITAFMLLLGIFIYLRKRFLITGLIIGVAFDIRIISAFLLIALIYIEYTGKNYKNMLHILIGFVIPLIFLLIFNYFIFGNQNIFEQFTHGDRYGGVNIGFIQLYKDILRTIDWGQYRILFSGLFYLIISLLALFVLYKKRGKSKILKIMYYWALFSTIFVFAASPFTFIENYNRYTLPYFGALVVGIFLWVKDLLKLKSKKIIH